MALTEFIKVQKEKEKLHYNYCGIVKKKFPKWHGWKIISKYKESDESLSKYDEFILDILVENFYYLEYIKNNH